MDLNIVTLFFFFLTIVVFIQLRNVLGKRTGNERPSNGLFSKKNEIEKENILVSDLKSQKEEVLSEIDTISPKESELNKGLREILESNHYFSPKLFCKGAQNAYEMIMISFSSGDREKLKKLLSESIYEDFNHSISDRENHGYYVKFSFVSVKEVKIISASIQNNIAYISVFFSSDIISCTYDKDKKIIDGDPKEIVEIRDYWTFVRDIDSNLPDWKLFTTEEDPKE